MFRPDGDLNGTISAIVLDSGKISLEVTAEVEKYGFNTPLISPAAVPAEEFTPEFVLKAFSTIYQPTEQNKADIMKFVKQVKGVKEGIQNAARSTAKADIKSYTTQQRKTDRESRKGHSDYLSTDNNIVGVSNVFNRDTNGLNRDLKRDYPDLEENERSFDDVLKDFLETDDATEIKAYIKNKGKEAITNIKTKWPKIQAKGRELLMKYIKENLQEAKITPDAKAVIDLITKQPMIMQKLKLINTREDLQPVFDFLLTNINPIYAKSSAQLRTTINQTITDRDKIKPGLKPTPPSLEERLKPIIAKLVQEVKAEKK
jgi:hypothetical protein